MPEPTLANSSDIAAAKFRSNHIGPLPAVVLTDALAVNAATNRSAINSKLFANVKDYGAIGNNVADDTIAIQSAVSTGKNVYFPEGKYKISADILVSNSQSVLNVQGYGSQMFRGDGVGKTTIRQITNAANGFRVTGMGMSAYLEWHDLTIEGPSAQTSTGCGIISDIALNITWRTCNVDLRWWQVGLKGPMVDILMENTASDGNVTGFWFQDSAGIGVHRNTIRHCQVAANQTINKTPIVAATGIRIDAGYGWIIDGLDCGSPYLNTLIQINGLTRGQIRGLSCEIYKTGALYTTAIDSSACGVSGWTITNCHFGVFGGSPEYPITQGRYMSLSVIDCAMSASWANAALIRKADVGENAISSLEMIGSANKVDLYDITSGLVTSSYYSNQFSTIGVAALPAASTSIGRIFRDNQRGANTDKLMWSAQRSSGTASYGWDDLNAYNTDARNGRVRNLVDSLIPNAGITATAIAAAGGSPASNLIDGNDATNWGLGRPISVAGTDWIKFDFGASNSPRVSAIRYLPYDSIQVSTITVQGSNDDVVWTEVGRFGTKTAIDATYRVNPLIGYRYYRLLFATTETAWHAVNTVSFFRAVVSGEIVGQETKTYASDVAADADTNLPSGAFYLLSGARTLFRKP